MVFSNQKWFKTADLARKDYHLGAAFATKDLKLPENIWVADEAATYVVLAVSQTAIQERLRAAKEGCSQYAKVDLKMVIFTPNEMKLWEGAKLLQEKLGMALTLISLASRQLSLCGGGHKYAWVAESLYGTQHSAKYQRPQRMISPLLSAGTDPSKIFAKMPKHEDRIAISIINKHVDEILKDVEI